VLKKAVVMWEGWQPKVVILKTQFTVLWKNIGMH